jgi:hypothetical protein
MRANTSHVVLAVGLALALAGCEEFSEAVPPEDLIQTERGAFTGSGRFFVIGVRPDGRTDAGGWIVEITAASDGSYATTNRVAAYLEGTADGRLGGAPRGQPCFFSGMAAQGEVLYATCVGEERAALVQVDLTAGSVRAGYFTTCNAEPAAASCQYRTFYPNGMAIDAAGRIYVSDSAAHVGELLAGPGSPTLTQIHVDAQAAAEGGALAFRHRAWFSTDLLSDGPSPNGVQIEGDVLYYANGANINKIRIAPDGSAGEFRVHYAGPLATYIDDFAIRDGAIVTAQALAPGLVALSASPFSGTARETGSYSMPLDAVPSSVSFQPEGRALGRIFPEDSLAVTSYFGGGVQVVPSSALR